MKWRKHRGQERRGPVDVEDETQKLANLTRYTLLFMFTFRKSQPICKVQTV